MAPSKLLNTASSFNEDASLVDVVESADEARRLRHPPLIVRDRLAAVLPGEGELHLERWGGGHSNVTFLVRRGPSEWVLRRPPRPPYDPRAHDVLRECKMLRALHDSEVPVPAVVYTCDDDNVIGAPFYLMKRVEGHVIRDSVPVELAGPGIRERLAEQLVDGLVALHATRWSGVDLPVRGGGERYLERQLDLWRQQWRRKERRAVPAVERLAKRLAGSVPKSATATIVHGDYKLDNVVFSADMPPTLAAVLDWEMATLGDRMADVGFLTAMWIGPGGDPVKGSIDRLLGAAR